jgi:hypothetical protein
MAGTLADDAESQLRIYVHLNRIINTCDPNMIYIIGRGHQKMAICRHQTAVRTASVSWGAIQRTGAAAVQASHGRKHGPERGPYALSRQR